MLSEFVEIKDCSNLSQLPTATVFTFSNNLPQGKICTYRQYLEALSGFVELPSGDYMTTSGYIHPYWSQGEIRRPTVVMHVGTKYVTL